MMRAFWLLLTTGLVVAAPPPPVRFNRDIRPILSDNCFACHGFDKNKRQADLRLDQRESAIEKKAFIPGASGTSELVRRIFSADHDEVMPPPESHKSLKPEEKELLRRWIDEGASYEPHWAYVPPVRVTPPAPPNAAGGPLAPIDGFIRDRLVREAIEPSPRANPRTLIRRLSLDLIGLPPTAAEVEDFVTASHTDAHAAVGRAVDRLLASKHFGERMAVPWLDVVRFSDTVGYHGDQNQRIFPYRDYVINAFNANKRFDQFATEQLAGDLLPNPTTEQLVATGYNRLNMMTREGGAQPGEYLAKYAGDRIRTLGSAFLGSTLGCCECHDHKFDPFLTKDFYSLQAFFGDVREWGVYNDYAYTPNPDLRGWSNEHPFPPEIEVDSPFLQHRADKLTARIQVLAESGAAAPSWTAVTPEKTETGWKAVVRGPLDLTCVRVRLPRGGFALKLNAHHGGTAPAPAAAPEPARGKARARAGYKPGPGEVPFVEAFANRRAARFANTADLLSVLAEWKADSQARETEHTAVYYFKQPVSLDAGEAVTLVVASKEAKEIELAVTDGAAIGFGAEPLVPVAPAQWQTFIALRRELAECRGGRAWTQVTVAQAPRPFRVLRRGNWMDTGGEAVIANIPAVFRDPAADAPDARLTRLDLARWLSSEQNPLTARAIVNRLWAQFFGSGLSAKLDDLGGQGEPPSHPELLDWLAVEFRESGWNVKHMVRLMVTSQTYAQESVVRPELAAKDPANRLLARQNLRRLEAEAVRDNALAIAGLLNLEDIGGPSIFPPQPPGYYENLNFPQRDYPVQTDDRHLRRSVYMHWQRTFLHPMLANFDAPSREECQADRIVSNTPQQALTLLNDPTFTEAAGAFAKRMLATMPAGSVAERLDYFFQHALGRPATADERASLVAFHARLLAQNEPPPEAWTQVARVILNLHQTITRE